MSREKATESNTSRNNVSEQRFGALRVVALLYDVLAAVLAGAGVLALLIGLVFAVGMLIKGADGNVFTPVLLGFGGLIGGTLAAVAAKSIAEVLRLSLALEEHTRRIATLERDMHRLHTLTRDIADNTRATAVILHTMRTGGQHLGPDHQPSASDQTTSKQTPAT